MNVLTEMVVGPESGMMVGDEPSRLEARGMPDAKLQSELDKLRAALAASQQKLVTAQSDKDAVVARLRESEELFRTRSAELARYQTELEAANDRLRKLSVTDDLTGLRNRRAFEERLAFEFSMARRKQRDLSVVLLDADNFKLVNDKLGHPAGDAVLQQLANVLQVTVRLTDLAVRYGGEEFAVILPENDERSAMLWCRRLQKALAAEAWEHGPVTVSMGVAGLGEAVVDGNHMVAMADQALYRAKHRGKDCFVSFNDLSIEQV